MRKILVPAFLVLLSGCVLRSGSGGSFDGLSGIHAGDAQILAERTAVELGQRYTPAHTALVLQKAPGAFGDILEQQLRTAGFALGGSGLTVNYKLDAVDDGSSPGLGYVQVTCSDGQLFSFSRPLGQPPMITEPPSTRPVPEDHPLESRPLPESMPAAAPPAADGPAEAARTAPVPNPVVPAPVQAASTPGTARPEPLPAGSTATGRGLYVPVTSKAKASVVAKRNGIPVADFCRWNDVTPGTTLKKGTMVFLVEPPAPVQAATAPTPSASASPAVRPPAQEQISPKLTLPGEPASVPAPVVPSDPVPTAPEPKAAVPAAASMPAPAVSAMPGSLPDEPAAEPVIEQMWEISKGQMLRGQMEGWAAVAGYSLIWNAQHDYEMRSSATFSGSFHDAVKRFYAALQASGLALRVTIYEGNKVMEVSEH